MKRILLVVAAAAAFLIGYGGAAEAWPGVPDRNRWYGYFGNNLDSSGSYVLPNGIPWFYSAGEFIQFIHQMLNSGNPRERVGAAFIIQTMRGEPWNRDNPPTWYQIAQWESMVYYAEANNLITWDFYYTYEYNSYWQGSGSGGNWNDDAFYAENGNQRSIGFRDFNGNYIYVLRRVCANPLGRGYMPGLEELYNTYATSTVEATAIPGQEVTFRHNIHNMGPTGYLLYSSLFEGPNSAGTGLSAQGNYFYLGGSTSINPYNERFTIPNNAAAGTRYCRLIGWDPTNSWGGRDGRGPEACVTVQIPAKLRAAMAASPKPIQPGDTITFRPSISATSNSSPIVVNCSINRTLFPPSGGSSNLGAQPCVDSGGNPNITIPPGGSVVLRDNTYASANTIAIGTRVCDTITITNPSNPAYFTNPADQTAQDCSTVAKSPYVHFTGGDVWAGGGFAAVPPGTCNTGAKITTVTRSRAVADGTTPGSGTTYAAFALGRITNFGSASMALVTSTGVGDNWTFSNINSGNLGFFGATQHCINDYAGTYASLPISAPPGINNPVSGAWHVNGPINLAGTMPLGDAPGGRKVYFVEGDVNINGNISYPASYANGAQIPSLVVIATGNIRVLNIVNRVDGIYIARGTFYTCHPKIEPAATNVCDIPLTITGAVSSTALDLFRTAGADGATPATQKAPAEVFNLSPEVFLNNALNQTTQTTITTSNVRELPPRF